jgi:Zn-dependent peptidase ImmA (M78 family)/DNA-binding XRE family transcriptional regulator
MDPAILGHNLRRLRHANGLKQGQMAERAKLSRVAYANIESGASTPRVDTLLRVAEALGVTLQDLVTPVRVLKMVRFRALKRMNTREQILVDVARWLENYGELEELLKDRAPFRLEPIAKKFASRPAGPKRARAAAVAARSHLKLGDSSIRDICGLLEERVGVKVYPRPLASDSFFGLSVGKEDGGPAIMVNVWNRISVERWIFTAAHELGHLILHLRAYDVQKTEEEPDQEAEANQFASHFLMPHEVFLDEWNEARGLSLVDRVLKVKRIFGVSYRTVLHRLAGQEAYGKEIWKKFQAAWMARFGHSLLKSDEPQALPPEDFQAGMVEPRAAGEPKSLGTDAFVEDRLSRLTRMALDKELISIGRAAEILDLDLEEMRERIDSWVA